MPYRDTVNSKPPVLFAIYYVIMAIFGATTIGIHIGLACYILLTLIALYGLCAELFHPRVGVLAAAIAAVLMAEPRLAGGRRPTRNSSIICHRSSGYGACSGGYVRIGRGGGLAVGLAMVWPG